MDTEVHELESGGEGDIVLEAVETAYTDKGEPASLNAVRMMGGLLEQHSGVHSGVFDSGTLTRRSLTKLVDQGKIVRVLEQDQERWMPSSKPSENIEFYLS